MSDNIKKYTFTLVVKDDDNPFTPRSVDKIESDYLLEILSQLPQVIAKIRAIEVAGLQAKLRMYPVLEDDDIPF